VSLFILSPSQFYSLHLLHNEVERLKVKESKIGAEGKGRAKDSGGIRKQSENAITYSFSIQSRQMGARYYFYFFLFIFFLEGEVAHFTE
jgi:hypothetical protein